MPEGCSWLTQIGALSQSLVTIFAFRGVLLTGGVDRDHAPLNRKVTKVGSITVPAGTFIDCLYLEGVIGGMTFEDWFCPGIGVVWHNAEHHGTPYGNRRELVSYRAK